LAGRDHECAGKAVRYQAGERTIVQRGKIGENLDDILKRDSVVRRRGTSRRIRT
jgi:hypothetical protein